MTEPEPELEALRAEVEDLRSVIRVLQSIVPGAHARQGEVPAPRPVQVGSRERMAMLEHAIGVLDGCVRNMAFSDCYGCPHSDGDGDDKCRPCQAQEALDSIAAWRYGGSMETPSRRFDGSMHYRTTNGWHPREAKIHAAWARDMERGGADCRLGQILTDRGPGQPDSIRDWPTARDWYVATSVVQWLATNVGSSILEAAGWKYTGWDEDRAALDAKRETTHTEAT